MAPTVKDVLTFHKIDRAVYENFIAHGMEPDKARKAVALFLWLEQLGIDMTTPIHKIINNNAKISALITEIDAVLRCLQQNDNQYSHPKIPLLTSLAQNNIDIRFFNLHRDSIVRALVGIIDGIGRHVFDCHKYGLLRAYESADAAAIRFSTVRPQVPPALAKLCAPAVSVLSSEQKRSMFITMRRWEPIGIDEIIQHFTAKWGNCIDTVMMERVEPGRTPIYGKIVFKSDTYVNLVLEDDNQILSYRINGNELRARKFIQQKIYQ